MDPEILQTQNDSGLSNSQPINEPGQLYQWLYQRIRPALKGKALEIGSGEGNISALFVQDEFPLRISDPHSKNCDILQKKFEGEPINKAIIKGIHQIDLTDNAFESTYAKLLGRFDTVVSMNEMEQDAYDPVFCSNAKKLLRDRGRLIMLLPIRTALFDESEDGLNEWYRLNRRNIRTMLGAGSEILSIQFFCVLQAPRSLIPTSAYHQLVPFFQSTEDTYPYQTGVYMIAVARNNIGPSKLAL